MILSGCTPWPAATASIVSVQSNDEGDSFETDLLLLSAIAGVSQIGGGGNAPTATPPCGGAAFCYVFVSTTLTDGSFGGVTPADARCATDKPGGLPGVGSDYKALLMSAGVSSTPARDLNTNWVLTASMEYRRPDGVTVIGTTNASREFPLPLTNAVQAAASSIYTGIDVSGANWVVGTNCMDWTSVAGGVTFEQGEANNPASAISLGGGALCTFTGAFYCVQQ